MSKIRRRLSREEFFAMAKTPMKLEAKSTIFVVDVYTTYEFEGKFQRYPIYIRRAARSYATTFEDAEQLVKSFIKSSDEEDVGLIYSIKISEYLMRQTSIYENNRIAWWLYDARGLQIDSSVCEDYESFAPKHPYNFFRGREEKTARFKAGDIVEVLCGNCVRLAVVVSPPMSYEECWQFYTRRIDLDYTEDVYTVVFGPGYYFHDHIFPENVFALHFPISTHQVNKFQNYFNITMEEIKK